MRLSDMRKIDRSDISIRQEDESDYVRVEDLVRKAFVDMPYSDHTEQELVQKLRRSEAYIPDLSLIAQCRSQIIGHILISKIEVVDLE